MQLLTLVLLPFVASVACALLPGMVRPEARSSAAAWLAGLTALACTALLLALGPPLFAGHIVRFSVPWFASVAFGFRLDGLAFLFALLICVIGALVVLYARYYLSPSDPPTRFFALLLLFVGAMLGVVTSDNLILLAVFWELTSVASFLLISFWNHREDARQGATMALAVTAGGGLCLLGGVVLLGHIAGGYDLDTVFAAGAAIKAHPLYLVALVLVLLGAFTKSAQFPFHFWLPHAMAAPTPVSAYLHSATMVKAGVFLLARFYPALGDTTAWFYLVGGTGLVTLTVGAFLAIFQQDIKGLLAYSTISHLGLITLLLGMGSPLAVVAAIFHIINHAAFKASLFMAAGIIDHETGSRDMRNLNGLWKLMPVTGALAVVATCAMAGVPLLNGFLSKEMFFAETLQLDAHPFIEFLVPLVATVAGALAVAYSVRFIHDVFFNGEPVGLTRTPHDPPVWMRVPVAVLVIVCVVVGIFPTATVGPLLALAARGALGSPPPEYSLALWHGVNLPLLMSMTATVAGVAFYFLLQKTLNLHKVTPSRFTGRNAFERSVPALVRAARRVLGVLPSSSLRDHTSWLILTVAVIVAWPLVREWRAGHMLPLSGAIAGSPPSAVVGMALWTIGLLAAVAGTAMYRQRMLALILIGATGLAVALAFSLMSAPDLALTQLVVEIATLALMMLVLHFLPQTAPPEPGRARRWRDAGLALAIGCGVTLIVAAVLSRPYDSIAPYYLAQALPAGGGTNVVNVILVDFRGFDTLGEITVLGVAALLVFALLGNFSVPAEHRAFVRGEQWNPLLLRKVSRMLLPLAALVAVFFFLRGHNLPGGGFVAGLIFSCAIVVLRISGAGKPIVDPTHMPYEPWMAGGILVACAAGLASIAFGYPFLTSATGHPIVPLLGELPLASASLFDLGVFLCVVSATLLATISPSLLPHLREPENTA